MTDFRIIKIHEFYIEARIKAIVTYEVSSPVQWFMYI